MATKKKVSVSQGTSLKTKVLSSKQLRDQFPVLLRCIKDQKETIASMTDNHNIEMASLEEEKVVLTQILNSSTVQIKTFRKKISRLRTLNSILQLTIVIGLIAILYKIYG